MESLKRLKERMLRLLKEDEEFRYAVAGFLGLEDLRESISELIRAQRRTEERVDALAEAQRRTEIALRELAVQVGKLSETIGFGLEDIAPPPSRKKVSRGSNSGDKALD